MSTTLRQRQHIGEHGVVWGVGRHCVRMEYSKHGASRSRRAVDPVL